MGLVVPALRLLFVFLNIYESFKVLKLPRPSVRNGGQPSVRSMAQRKRDMKGVMTIWIVWVRTSSSSSIALALKLHSVLLQHLRKDIGLRNRDFRPILRRTQVSCSHVFYCHSCSGMWINNPIHAIIRCLTIHREPNLFICTLSAP